MEPFKVEVYVPPKPVRKLAIGVGKVGISVIEYMIKENFSDIEMIQIDTALDSYAIINKHLQGIEIVFIIAGFDGGIETDIAPSIAKIAKKLEILTISTVCKSYKFKGIQQRHRAKKGFISLKQASNSIIVIPCKQIITGTLAETVRTISNLLLRGEFDVSIVLDDLKDIFKNAGIAHVGDSEYRGKNAADKAVQMAIKSPFLNNMPINGAMCILIQFHMHPNFPMLELCEAMEIIHDCANEEALVIFTTTSNKNMNEDHIRIILVATDFSVKDEK